MLGMSWANAHPLLLNVVVQLLFGAYGPFAAAAFSSSHVHPLVFAFYRDALAAAILLCIAYAIERRKPSGAQRFWPAAEDFGIFAFLGLTGVYGLQGMSAMAVANVPTTYYTLCTPLQPVSCLAISVLVGQEPLPMKHRTSWAKAGGILVTVIGAICMSTISSASDGLGNIVSRSKNFIAGSVFITLQVLSAGAYNVSQKPVLHKYPPQVVAAWGYVAGAALLLCAVLPCSAETGLSGWTIDSATAWAALGYSVLFCSCFNYVAMAYINSRTSPVLVTAFNPFQGLFGALLSAFVLHQPIGVGEYLGGALMVTGLLMTVWAKLKEGQQGYQPVQQEAAAVPEELGKDSVSVQPAASHA